MLLFENMPKEAKVIISAPEDDIERVLIRRLTKAGANLDNIIPLRSVYKIDSDGLFQHLAVNKPILLIVDPIQAHLSGVNMNARNAMRDVITNLILVTKETGTTVIIVMHTNKRENTGGRNRLSDSSDLWDSARSVIMVGKDKDGKVNYISHEKSNYGKLQRTVLFTLNGDTITKSGESDKKDADFQNEKLKGGYYAPAREECEGLILTTLRDSPGKKIFHNDLEEVIMSAGCSETAFKNAKNHLRKEGKIEMNRERKPGGSWIVSLNE